jgi:glycerate 2-kinase
VRVLIAPASFKGSLAATRVAEVIRQAIRACDPAVRCIMLPQADGGEGTIDAIHFASGGELRYALIPDLAATVRSTPWLMSSRGALIEAATCIGWQLPAGLARQPAHFYSTGLGLLLQRVREWSDHVTIALGGTATADCGLGMLEALGAILHCDAPREHPVYRRLATVRAIDGLATSEAILEIIADVSNPLTGPNGAIHTFGPQKGIPAGLLDEWDAAFLHFAETVRRDLGNIDVKAVGTGAAGGLGFACAALADTLPVSGADAVRRLTGFEQELSDCELVITGEGCIDAQTLSGKVVQGIAAAAARLDIPVLAVAGKTDGDPTALASALGVTRILSITPPDMSVESGMRNAAGLLHHALREAWRDIGRG